MAALFFCPVFFLVLGSVTAAGADPFVPRVGAKSFSGPHGTVGAVTVNDRPVASFRTSAGGLNPAQRALNAKLRLSDMARLGLSAVEVAAVSRGPGGWVVVGRGQPLLTATKAEAAAQHQSAKRLATGWAASLKRGLAEPGLTVSARQFLLPFGSTKVLTLGGAALPADISADGGDPRIVTTIYDAAARRLSVRGIGPGTTTLTVKTAGISLPISVTVKKYAAFVVPQITVRVTGRPDAPASLVQNAVYLGLKRALNATPGAQVRLLKTPARAGLLRPGASLTRRVDVRVAGADLLPVTASPRITVVNQPLPVVPALALFYSNNPEQVRESRKLFTAPLSPGRPIRLDYHHQNSSGQALVFHADAVNAGDQTVTVHLMAGVASPEVDTVAVGQKAGFAFLRALDGGLGLVLEVPPHARVPLVAQAFAPKLTVSGILEVQQLGGPGGAVSVAVSADGDRQTLASSPLSLAQAAERTGADARLVSAPAAPLASGMVADTSPYVFGPPRVSLDASYAVGGLWAHVRLGNAESLRNAAGTQILWGNYGVSYFITLKLTNPAPTAKTVAVLFAPEAGLAAGVFEVDGRALMQFPPMPPPTEEEVARVRLQPGESRTVRVRTLLLNGSAYPASLVVHAL